jgi:hypothetical protein
MQNRQQRPRFATGAVALILLTVAALPAAAAEPGLAILMQQMQTYTHKLQLSLEARNPRLVDFYLHELEENAEYVAENIERYREHPVGEMTAQMLLPVIERMEGAVEESDWALADRRFAELLEACNACHLTTGHAAIRIVPASINPFAQDFSVQPD